MEEILKNLQTLKTSQTPNASIPPLNMFNGHSSGESNNGQITSKAQHKQHVRSIGGREYVEVSALLTDRNTEMNVSN